MGRSNDSTAIAILVACMAACACGGVAAAEVFRSVDADGVVTFSDVETRGAERIVITPPVADLDARAHAQSVIDQQLAVAGALEASRLAREAARLERMKAAAALVPRVAVVPVGETRYVGGYSSEWWGWHGGYPGRPPGHHPRPPGHPPGRPEPPMEPPGGGPPASPSRPMHFPSSGSGS